MNKKIVSLMCPMCDDALGAYQRSSDDPDCAYILESSCVDCAILVQAYTPTAEYFKKFHDKIANEVEHDNFRSRTRH